MTTNRIESWDALEDGPLAEPWQVVGGHKVYRKESCTLDHKPVRARKYFGLWQCRCCDGIIAPQLRRTRTLSLAPIVMRAHTNGNGNHKEVA